MFELSPDIDKNKIFLVNLSEIEGRLDPYFFHRKFNVIEKKLPKNKRIKLRYISKNIFSGITPKSKGDAYTTKEDGIPFIRSGDFSEDNLIDFTKINYIKKEVHNDLMKSSQLKKGDILIAIVGATIGKVGVYKYDYEANINQAICAIRLNQSYYIPDFIQIFLLTSLGQIIIDRLKRPVARANINLEEISNIPLPKISVFKQKKIIEYYKNQIKIKQQKEAEAERLLNSIDDYLLKELGISLPEKDNSLENRIFKVNFSEVTGGRFDPRYYQKYFIKFYQNIGKKYEVKKLKKISKYIGSGSTPKVGGDAYTNKQNGIPFIRITNIKNDTIDLSDVLYIKKDIHNNLLKRTQLNSGDLLLSMAGTIGLTVIVPDFIQEANINQALARIILNENVNNYFIKEVLNSKIGKIQTDRLSRPSVQSNINFNEIGSLLIPILPIEKQNEIAEHIKEVRNQAKQLKSEAKEVLEQAKQEVEKMILGE